MGEFGGFACLAKLADSRVRRIRRISEFGEFEGFAIPACLADRGLRRVWRIRESGDFAGKSCHSRQRRCRGPILTADPRELSRITRRKRFEDLNEMLLPPPGRLGSGGGRSTPFYLGHLLGRLWRAAGASGGGDGVGRQAGPVGLRGPRMGRFPTSSSYGGRFGGFCRFRQDVVTLHFKAGAN